MSPRPDPIDPLVVKKQNLLRVFFAAAAGCAAAFALAQYSHNFQREALSALALLGSIFAIWTLLRFLRVIDEFERQYTHEALRFAFVGMLSLLVLEVCLESFGFPCVPAYGNVAFAVILWSLGLAISSWQRHWRHE
jgi:hypothetical protein